MRRPWIATLATVAAAVAAAPAAAEPPPEPVDPPLVPRGPVPDPVDPAIADGSAQQALDAARARWRATGLRSYRYRARRICFCAPRYTRAARIVVRRGHPADPPARLRRVATVPRLLRRVQDAIDDRVASLTVRYGGRGVPHVIAVDVSRMIADEEYTFRVRRFRPG
jgi:Family of unknown function (DUF6174)